MSTLLSRGTATDIHESDCISFNAKPESAVKVELKLRRSALSRVACVTHAGSRCHAIPVRVLTQAARSCFISDISVLALPSARRRNLFL